MNAAQRYDLMDAVLAYIKDVLVPYYQESLTPACQEVTRADNLTLVNSAFADILRVCHLQVCNFKQSQKNLQNVQALIWKWYNLVIVINIYYNAYIPFSVKKKQEYFLMFS